MGGTGQRQGKRGKGKKAFHTGNMTVGPELFNNNRHLAGVLSDNNTVLLFSARKRSQSLIISGYLLMPPTASRKDTR